MTIDKLCEEICNDIKKQTDIEKIEECLESWRSEVYYRRLDKKFNRR